MGRREGDRGAPGPAAEAKRTAWTRHPWPRQVPDGVWAPLVAGFLTLLAGGLGVLTGNLLWLFPSLGPTVYLQTVYPAQPDAQFRNVIGGHSIGILAGYLAVFALGLAGQPSVLTVRSLSPARAMAGALAVAVTLGGALLADVSHPPAAATTLLIALGAFPPVLRSAIELVAGIAIVALAGEFFRRLRLGGFRRHGRSDRGGR